MELTVEGLDAARIKMNKEKPYVHLWGRYVSGFRPWRSCIASFKTTKERLVTPLMKDGTYQLLWATDLFYLCGVGQDIKAKSREAEWRRHTNVHLAVRKKPGSSASLTSAYGVTFTISDSEAIDIEPLPGEISTYLNANPAILNPNGEPGITGLIARIFALVGRSSRHLSTTAESWGWGKPGNLLPNCGRVPPLALGTCAGLRMTRSSGDGAGCVGYERL